MRNYFKNLTSILMSAESISLDQKEAQYEADTIHSRS
jgi:hypothetical protein